MSKISTAFKEGILSNNPVLVQLLGMCSTLATSTALINGLGMGLSTTAVLICSNVVISLLRKIIPNKIRIAGYIVVVASFVTVVDMLLKAYAPSLSASLGVFIPLIVVNCIILGRAEAFASKNGVGASALDGLTMGLGFTCTLAVMGIIRELIGSGTFGAGLISDKGLQVFGAGYPGATLFILPAGAFLVLGCLIAALQHFLRKGGNN